jgi:hypothetical protein
MSCRWAGASSTPRAGEASLRVHWAAVGLADPGMPAGWTPTATQSLVICRRGGADVNALLRAVEWLLVGVFLIRTEAVPEIPLRFYRFGLGSDHEMSPADGCQGLLAEHHKHR